MSRVQLIIGFLVLAFIAQVEAHGHLAVPRTRDLSLSKRQDEQNAPTSYPFNSDFVCRNYSASPQSQWTTLVAGSKTPIQWGMEAAHPGDCFVYLSYDSSDNIPDIQKKWFKIASFSQCNLQNTQMLDLEIPSYLPSCEHCILRWEWYALHLQAIDIVEFYSQCSDVKITGRSTGSLPTPQVTIPGHLPMDAKQYRPGFNSQDLHMTGPAIATLGGASYDCVATYGSSCIAPSPTNNPCEISTQRCVSANTYQACGIGSTTTQWGAEQTCQTGLVCANHPDGKHIMCTFPSNVPATPTPAPVAPATTASQISNVPSVNVPSTPIPVPTIDQSNDVCVLQSMKCIGESSYQTCSRGNSGNYWAAAQSCQSGMYCSAQDNVVYCLPNKPSTPVVSVPSTSSPKPSTTASVKPSTSSANVQAQVPSSSTTGQVATPSPVRPSTTSSSNMDTQCTLGSRKCSAGGSSYQTCTNGNSVNYWSAAQLCPSGQTCVVVPGMTDNIWCVRA